MLPYSHIWAEAMRIGARPNNISNTTNLLWSTFDTIFKLSGEKNPDFLYPIKRTTLAMSYFSTEVALLNFPGNEEEHWRNLESQIIRTFHLGSIGANLLEVGKFVMKTNYRVLESFYPEPTSHKHPINNNY